MSILLRNILECGNKDGGGKQFPGLVRRGTLAQGLVLGIHGVEVTSCKWVTLLRIWCMWVEHKCDFCLFSEVRFVERFQMTWKVHPMSTLMG